MTFSVQLSGNCTVEILKAPNQPHKHNTCAYPSCNQVIHRTSTYCRCHAMQISLPKRLVTLKRTFKNRGLMENQKP